MDKEIHLDQVVKDSDQEELPMVWLIRNPSMEWGKNEKIE